MHPRLAHWLRRLLPLLLQLLVPPSWPWPRLRLPRLPWRPSRLPRRVDFGLSGVWLGNPGYEFEFVLYL